MNDVEAFFRALASPSHAPGRPLDDAEIVAWRRAHPGWPLPDDLVELYRRHDGWILWVDADTRCGGHFVMRSLRDLRFAPHAMYGGPGPAGEGFPPSWVCLSDDPDSASFVVLDTATGTYLDVDPISGPDEDEAEVIGRSVTDLLAWVAETKLAESPFEV